MAWILLVGAVVASIGMTAFAFWLIAPLSDLSAWLLDDKRGRRRRVRKS